MEVKKTPFWGKRGLKFQTAATELNLISDEFFDLRNHNNQYTFALEKLKKEINLKDKKKHVKFIEKLK